MDLLMAMKWAFVITSFPLKFQSVVIAENTTMATVFSCVNDRCDETLFKPLHDRYLSCVVGMFGCNKLWLNLVTVLILLRNSTKHTIIQLCICAYDRFKYKNSNSLISPPTQNFNTKIISWTRAVVFVWPNMRHTP
jgi:hypothetical protein